MLEKASLSLCYSYVLPALGEVDSENIDARTVPLCLTLPFHVRNNLFRGLLVFIELYFIILVHARAE